MNSYLIFFIRQIADIIIHPICLYHTKKIINAICLVVMLGIVIYHTNLKINNQDCIFLRTSQFPIAIYTFALIYFLFFFILYCITYVENVISQNTSLL